MLTLENLCGTQPLSATGALNPPLVQTQEKTQTKENHPPTQQGQNLRYQTVFLPPRPKIPNPKAHCGPCCLPSAMITSVSKLWDSGGIPNQNGPGEAEWWQCWGRRCNSPHCWAGQGFGIFLCVQQLQHWTYGLKAMPSCKLEDWTHSWSGTAHPFPGPKWQHLFLFYLNHIIHEKSNLLCK